MEEITRESYKETDINALALDPRFGSLKFNKCVDKLEKIKNWFIEFDELDYRAQVPVSTISQIEQRTNQLVEHLNWLRVFDISSAANPKAEHDAYEELIIRFYDDVFNQLIISHLDFLRQEAALKSKDRKDLRKQQREIIKLKKEYRDINKQLNNQLNKLADKEQALTDKEQAVESKSGEVAAIIFGKHFEAQYKDYKKDAKNWSNKRDFYFKWLLGIIIANFLTYFYLLIAEKYVRLPSFPPGDLFTAEYGFVKLALLLVLSYSVGFASKNYSISSHLAAVNTHRKNVAETLKDFLNTNPRQDDRSELVRSGSNAMFSNIPTGYLRGDGNSSDREPISGVLSTAVKNKD